ncbi:sensor histidine kinase [Puniceicoccales bacterium CK1056]|uniref:histidine kinase n=1 Tax=Oceanipulchritudo coccoides TaxID=2706888 RepID=A0A6B2M061_9BACT|nr:ATP-binding protein [Oceanipulchritudo coccoides]NDV62341.1 sensor histidine kinase [Oceanipulchritudo coccoides]
MGAFQESRPSPSSKPDPEILVCPEDVDWIFDVDTLHSAGGEALIRRNGLEEPPRDSPHHPFNLSASSTTVWDQTVRKLSMAAGESHLVLTAHSNSEAQEIVFYARVAGFREKGLPRIAATFQRINQSSYQSVADNVRQNWLYLLHEIKNPLSILKAADDIEYMELQKAEKDPSRSAQTRRFAITCLEDHLRNGVFLATEDSRMIPNNPEPLDLKLFMEDLRESFELILGMENNNIELKLDIEAFQVARIDRTLLSQLLNNLLLNKINLLQNETVTLDCSLASSRSDGSGTLLVITIEDEGPAFPAEVLQEQESDPNLEGLLRIQRNSGLGLPICRRIASVMGGEIKFYNDAPKTRIRIWLPLS